MTHNVATLSGSLEKPENGSVSLPEAGPFATICGAVRAAPIHDDRDTSIDH